MFPLLILALASASPLPGLAEASGTSVKADSLPEFSTPFGCGRTFPVSQAHDTGSHLMNDTWAWDFRMPSG
ncbi:MAG TPA: M23 family peptidase, partial [Myxococcaceae bacterium]|nr:M23 family peptidase [Myxococcaceae bacterium]